MDVTTRAKAHITRLKYGILNILDASLLQDNLYFIKTREESMKDKSVAEILRMIADLFDIIYFSGRKFRFGRGGGSLVRDEEKFHSMEDLVPMITPGGGLGAHIDASDMVGHIPQEQYPAGAFVCALYICGGIRGMERGTLSGCI